ncbi:CCA tRNA nucleotidyltransferase [Companilactobacillus allii]|uniref:CCA-adding enzyme n=1 Tax=Companilactobacillus allii TaxID=1847728 RepID=A0A1P8Q4Y8_9LACO|nr:CCA tRNA nucleotidyltransferase [Companilactobacillus allii]APX72914.1 CCA tRNA nucleotidyltransferase [Companilactobacillus allii]USQ67702.1 CCA tRNA nucleotidyltransferase [Companilactobacillus allii]
MRIKQLPSDFKKALPVLEEIEKAGFEAYFVGGSVRDHILGLPIHDVDIATSAYPEEIKTIFNRTIDTGIQHGTVTVLFEEDSYEITTFRTESGYQDFRRPDSVTFVRSLEDDLKRRDFTINALAVDRNGRVIDKFDGLADLNKRVIRAVGKAEERFHEDALRMMRAVRFQSQLGFTVEAETAIAIKDNAHLLNKIAIERIREEFIKLMLGKSWQIGFSDFLNLDLFEYCPSFNDQKSNLEKLLKLDDKSFVDEQSAWTAIGYVMDLEPNQFNKMLRDWKVSNKSREISVATDKMLKQFKSGNFDIWDIYCLGVSNFDRVKSLCQLFRIEFDDDTLTQKVVNIPIESSHDLAITGNDVIKILGIKPGPEIGKYMSDLEHKVVEGNVYNNFDKLREYLLSK